MFEEKKLVILTSLLAISSSFFAAVMWVEGRYAKTNDLSKIKVQVQINKISVTKLKVLSIRHAAPEFKEAIIGDIIKELDITTQYLLMQGK